MFGFIVTELDELHCLYKYRGVGVDRKEGEGKFPESTGNLAGMWMGMAMYIGIQVIFHYLLVLRLAFE
jgi:hypothetical protein